MNRYLLSILLGCFAVSLSIDVIARGNGGMGSGKGNGGMGMLQQPVFADFDTNLDGLISEEEFDFFQKARQDKRKSEGRLLRNSSYSDGMFERVDIDHNEFIDTTEFQSHRGAMRSSKS